MREVTRLRVARGEEEKRSVRRATRQPDSTAGLHIATRRTRTFKKHAHHSQISSRLALRRSCDTATVATLLCHLFERHKTTTHPSFNPNKSRRVRFVLFRNLAKSEVNSRQLSIACHLRVPVSHCNRFLFFPLVQTANILIPGQLFGSLFFSSLHHGAVTAKLSTPM